MSRNGNFDMTVRYGGSYGRSGPPHGHNFKKYQGPPKKTGALLDTWNDRSSKSDDDRRMRGPTRTKQLNRERSRSRDKSPEVLFSFLNF